MLRLSWRIVELLRLAFRALTRLPRGAAIALGGAAGDQPARAGRLPLVLLIVLPIAWLAAWCLPRVTLVMSPSIDAWAVRVAPGPIRVGDLVRYRLVHPVAGPNPVDITKRALCMPGARLTMIELPSRTAPRRRDAYYFCDGAALGISLPYSRKGVALSHMRWQGIIPPGLAYIGSHHPYGFDSRYFGLVPLARLTRMERLL